MDNRGAETHLGRRRDRQGPGRCSEEGPALQDELERTKQEGVGGRGEGFEGKELLLSFFLRAEFALRKPRKSTASL